MGRGGFILNTQKYYNYSELHLFKVTDISWHIAGVCF
jgi:hypothetical protein